MYYRAKNINYLKNDLINDIRKKIEFIHAEKNINNHNNFFDNFYETSLFVRKRKVDFCQR